MVGVGTWSAIMLDYVASCSAISEILNQCSHIKIYKYRYMNLNEIWNSEILNVANMKWNIVNNMKCK